MPETLPGAVPAAEITNRVARFQAHLERLDLCGALLAQNSDLFYFAGTIQQAHLYIPAAGQPVLMVRKHLPRAEDESPLERIVALDSPRQIPAVLADFGLPLPRRLGLELDVLPAQRYLGLCRLWPDTQMRDVSDAIRRVRAVKSAHEIDLIREAARRADLVAAAVPQLLGAGTVKVTSSNQSRVGQAGRRALQKSEMEHFPPRFIVSADSGLPRAPLGGS